MDIKLNIYDDDFNEVIETVEAQLVKVPFGTIRKLMTVFNIDNLKDTKAILEIVLKMWDDVVKILDRIFPGLEDEDWDHVDTQELVGVILQLLKFSAKKLTEIPTDSKN